MCSVKMAIQRWSAVVLFLLACQLLPKESYGQQGPGGIGDKYGNSALLLWLDAAQISKVAHGNNLGYWEDLSGYGNHAVQNNSNKPNYYTNQLNSQPTVAFDGTNAAMQGQFHVPVTAPVTIFALVKFHAANQGVNDNDYILSLGSGTSAGQHTSIARRKSDTPADINKYYSWDGTNTQFGPVINGNTWLLFEQLLDTALPYHQLHIDGLAQTVSDFPVPFQSNGAFHIGKWIQLHQHHLDGEIAELIVYSKQLNDAELTILRSYFAAKYNLPIAGDKYSGDDAINDNNDFQVAGIGKASNGILESAASEALLISIDSNFQQNDYLLFGNQNQVHGLNTTDAADLSGRLQARWEKSWWFDVTDTGDPMQVNLYFDLNQTTLKGMLDGNPENYRLLYRPGTSGDWSLVDSATYYLNNRIYFEHTVLNNDGYYTLGTIDLNNSPLGTPNNLATGNGPGGVGNTTTGSSLKMWLDANDISGSSNDLVITWPDRSGNNNDAVQANYVELPNLQTQVVNGNSAIRFDGNNDYMEGNFNSALKAPCTIVITAFFSKLNQANNDNAYLMSVGQNGPLNEHIGLSRRRANVANDRNKYYSYDGTTTRFGPVLTGQQWTLLTQQMDTTAPYHQLSINNQAQSVSDYTAPFNTSATLFRLGRYVGNNTGNYHTGDLAEVIVYDRLLNTAEINILHSALSAQYDIPISNDKYAGDDPLNGDHDWDVVGIGQEADGSQNNAASAGLHVSIENNFQNGDYLLMGKVHDTNTVRISDIGHSSSLIQARWERTWWLDITNTGALNNVNVTFDFSEAGINEMPDGNANGYHLLYRSGNSGNWSTIAHGSSVLADQIHFDNVTLNNDGYYTLGTSDLTENPLGPNLDFGNGVWNVHVFEGTAFIRQKGSYVHDTLHFDSRQLWPASGSPSSAPSYIGSLAPEDYHSITYKRRSFPCDMYQIDIGAHKDSATLIIDGNVVWQHGGCCDSHTNVWTGQLHGESEVELRWISATGDSYLAVNFTPATTNNTWLGNSSDWFASSNWSLAAVPTASHDVYLPANTPFSPTINTSGATCNNINITDGAQFVITSSGTLDVSGNWQNQSRIVTIEGRLNMNGDCSSNSITNVYQQAINTLEINHTGRVKLLGNRLTIKSELNVTAGTLHTGNLLTLASTSEGTAHVSNMAGDSIIGNAIVERYIDGGATNWRFLTSPVNNLTFSSWNDDFITSGFPGSDYPSFPFVSIYRYAENTLGPKENGYEALSNINSDITPGEGFWVWCGDQLSGTQPFTIDVEGPLNQKNINLALSHTTSAGITEDGWNLVGNPYAATIDWDAPFWIKSNVNNAIYIWNPDIQQYAAYVAGIGVNGGSNVIASSQAFWVQTNAPNPVLQATEQVKTNSATHTQFLRKKPSHTQQLTLTLSGNGKHSDETVIYPEKKASMAYDYEYDARKLYSSHPNALSLLTISEQQEFAVNAIPVLSKDTSLLLKALVPQKGNYSFHVKHETTSAWTCIQLIDLFAGISYPLDHDTILQFYLHDTTTIARFRINLGGKVIHHYEVANCINSFDGSITLKGQGSGPWQYTIQNLQSTNDKKTVVATNAVTFRQLQSAPYRIEVSNSGYCGTIEKHIDLSSANHLKANFTYSADTNKATGAIELQFENKSIDASRYLWDFGNGSKSTGTHPTAKYNQNGIYDVTLIAEKGNCADTSTSVINIAPLTGTNTLSKPLRFDVQLLGKEALIITEVNTTEVGLLQVHNADGKLLKEVTIYPGKQQLRMHLGTVAAGLLNFTLYHGTERRTLKRINTLAN